MNKVNGISHITLICKDLEKSAHLFCELFDALEVYSSEKKNFSISKEKFLLIGNLWIALMEGPPLERSYNHIAFSIEEESLPIFKEKIQSLGLEEAPARPRNPKEGKSIYFYDYDNHLFELHTGTLTTRLNYYQNNLKLRQAERADLEWINKRYDEVEFVHSDFDNEIIAIAELDGQTAGLGRLVKIDQMHLELGGMYVFESFRSKGVAKELINFLLQHVKSSQIVYCIPFEHLSSFYKKYGFSTCAALEEAPKVLLKKYLWCKEKYNQPTSLLIWEKK